MYRFQLSNIETGQLIFESQEVSSEQMQEILTTFENTEGGIRKIRAKNKSGIACVFREEHFDKLYLRFYEIPKGDNDED